MAAGSAEVVTKMTPAVPLDTPKPGFAAAKPQLGAHAAFPSFLKGGGEAIVGMLAGPTGFATDPTQPAFTVSMFVAFVGLGVDVGIDVGVGV